MRRLILAAVSLLSVTAAAHAADTAWNGFYIGGNIGSGSAHAKADFSVLGVPAINGAESLKGAVYGGQAGYNMQSGYFVLGLEADLQATSQKATSSRFCAALACGALAITQSSSDSLPWFATGRVRAGIAVDRVLIYGTGGLAYGSFKSTQTLTTILGSVTTTTSDARAAFVVGAGVEVKISGPWSAKLEYLHLDTGNTNTTYSLAGIGAVTEVSKMTDDIIRLGVNYRF
jgi:outer membrane immunogenic protein